MTAHISNSAPFDFAIIGSGFAASTLALVLSRLDFRCALLDRQTHPRFAIGESSTPIADQILLDLAQDFDLPELAQLGRYQSARENPAYVVGCKQGFSYFFHRPKNGNTLPPVDVLAVPAAPDAANADSHFLRAGVDHFLCDRAIQRGVRCIAPVMIQAIRWDGTVWQLSWGAVAGTPRQDSLRARFVIDASGEAQVLLRHLGIASSAEKFLTDTAAVFGHFHQPMDWDNVWRNSGIDGERFYFPLQHAAVHHVVSDAWMWHLGFDNQVVSQGWVVSRMSTGPARLEIDNAALPQWWQQRLERYPSIAAWYPGSDGTNMVESLRQVSRIQRLADQTVGDHWLALPATAGSVDPLHSTGMAHSLVAVQRLVMQLRHHGELSPDFLRAYQRLLEREFWVLDRIVASAYQSLGQPQKWEAAVMLYFAAAIAFEEARNRRRQTPVSNGAPPHLPGFLLADDHSWVERVVRGQMLLSRDKPPALGWLASMNEILGPYNTAGLCDETCGGSYRYTTAKK